MTRLRHNCLGLFRLAEKSRTGCLMLGLLLAGCATPPGEIPQLGVRNFDQVDARLYRSAQPNVDGVAALAARGVKTIINLRLADDVMPGEETSARAHGIAYKNIPLAGVGRPTDEQVNTVLALIDSSTPPVLVHCKRGADRTGMMVACYRIRHDGWSPERALDEAKAHGMAWGEFGMKAFVRDFARKEKGPDKTAPLPKSSALRPRPELEFIR